jgi:hypothetical protein
MMRLQRTERPIRTHQHVDGAILANQDRHVTGFQLGAIRGSGGFENALGVCQEIRHEILIAPERRVLSGTLSEILARNAEPSHHGVQRRSGHSEAGGCGADHTSAFSKHPNDMVAFHLLERSAAGRLRRIFPYLG